MGRRSSSRLAGALLAGCILAACGAASAATPSTGSPLIDAARDDMTAEVRTLVADNANLNSQDETGATALAWAVVRGNRPAVEALIEAGADPNVLDGNGVGPLQLAIVNGATDLVGKLLDAGAKPNTARSTGETPLMAAIRVGSPEMVRLLLAKGAEVNVSENKYGQTPLMWAAGKPEITKMLLERGADVNAVTKSWDVTATIYTQTTSTLGVTGIPWNNAGDYTGRAGGLNPLLFAVQKRDLESVRMLLDAGLDANKAAADGSTALLSSLYNWELSKEGALKFSPDLKIANLLLDRGAKVSVHDRAGYTPLHGAALYLVLVEGTGPTSLAFHPTKRSEPNRARPKPPKPEAEEEVLALVKRMLDMGADPNAATGYPTPGPVGAVRINPAPPGSTPLHIAAASHSPRLITLMTSKGADPNRTRQDGHTPLSVAAMTNDLPVVQELVARGGDPKMRFNPADQVADPVEAKTEKRENQTILHIAGISGSEWVVEYLAKAGAPLTATNSKGETPLDIADAQERFRDAHDREGPLGVGIGSEVVRETQTSDAFKRAMGQTRVASQGATSRAQ